MQDQPDFLNQVERIEGWLNRPAAVRSRDLLTWQKNQDIPGGMLEIGVFCGKYFALMVENAIASGAPLLGIDTFQYAPVSRVETEMATLFGDAAKDRFTLWERSSTSLTAEEILAQTGKCRFISIDGSHDYEDVFCDLVLAEKVLGDQGIISADDFLNPLTLGVNQAINHFFAQPRSIVPVAYTANKLFIAHRASADKYRNVLERFFAKGKAPYAEAFRQRRENGRHHIEQPFHGGRVLIG